MQRRAAYDVRAQQEHGRYDHMAVILDEADWPKWLGEQPAAPDELYATQSAAAISGSASERRPKPRTGNNKMISIIKVKPTK
jgi:putative SOS response-associated peptidase YedK